MHPSWVFSAPGTYKVTVAQTAHMASGDVNGTTQLTFNIGGQGNANEGHLDARDANSEGTELSRIVIPEELSFLGTPGDTVWTAPQSVKWLEQWRPLWSGLGAFDPAHEPSTDAIPTTFVKDTMQFDMIDFRGPGEMQIFFQNAVWPPERVFSSGDPALRTVDYKVGAHGHFNWTFTKPGIYAITWQGRAEHEDGQV